MKLAIASTTILFAMMAAQAAVLSVAPATDVNLVKRTPNGDDDDEQTPMTSQSSLDQASQFPMAGQSSSDSTSQDPMDDQSSPDPTSQDPMDDQSNFIFKHGLYCGVDHGGSCINAGALAADLNSDIVELGEKLKITMEEYQAKLKEQNEFKEAEHLED
ncbi:hypothetical protein BASA61_004577 [Batrachochytrium salamandrivorans]|nr:hypothetical protein BASA61_004577 [Batrachochytrium salamandrivorans]